MKVFPTLKKKGEKFGYLKLDTEEAYDSLELDFIKKCVQGLCFSNQWLNWIWKCIRTTNFRMTVNCQICL